MRCAKIKVTLVSNFTTRSVVQVRGLLFLDGGAYKLVAGRIRGAGA